MSINVQAADVTLLAIGDSWTQDNRERFLWPRMPQARVLTRSEGYTGVYNYQLPNLDNFMAKDQGLQKWQPGQSKRAVRPLGKSQVTLNSDRYDLPPMSRPSQRQAAHRWRDLEMNVIPGMLGQMYQQIDQMLRVFLTDVGTFGAAVAFTNGGGALDNKADQANQSPLQDMLAALIPLRKYANRSGFQLECVIDEHVLDVFAGHPDFTGAGTGSAIASVLEVSAVEAIMRSRLRLDDVHIMRVVSDTVRRGQPSAINNIYNGVLGFYVMDRRGDFDLRSQDSPDAPDGAVVMGLGQEPQVRNNIDERHLTEYFDAEADFGFLSPRGTDFGLFFQATGPGGIFTTLPA